MGHWSWSTAVDPLVLLTIIAILSGTLWQLIKIMRRFERRFNQFQEDWDGTQERPGVPARAGVMERLSLIEVAQTDTRHRLDLLVIRINKGRP